MLKIVVPRVGAPGPTERRLQEWGVDYDWALVDGGGAYGHLLASLWREAKGFLLIEHDVVPTDRAQLEEIRGCREPWCAAPYVSPVMMYGMGVTKLTAEALAVSQDLPPVWEGTHWGLVDSQLIPALASRFPLHGHFPPFDHQRHQ